MDQLRKLLGWLKRQHFWVLSVLAALIAMLCWWSGAGTLRGQFDANKKAIDNEFTQLSGLQAKPFHPNQTINDKQIDETKKQAENVAAIWQQLYDRQRENVLEWPGALSQELRDYVEKRKFGEEIPPHLRDNYQNYVERHFRRLPEKVGARVMSEGESSFGGEGYGGGMSMGRGYRSRGEEGMSFAGQFEEQDDYICEWLDQARVREELDFPQRPSALRIWVTQENLWVYHTLLQVIKNTNDAAGATRMSNAAVRVIYSLEVGRLAARSSRGKGRIYMLPSVAADPMMGAEGEMMGAEGGMEGSGREGGGEMPGGEMGFMDERGAEGGLGGGPMSDAQEQSRLLSWRYLDAEGKPISIGGGADPSMMADPSIAADPAAPAAAVTPDQFGVEYKRLPIRMELQMDQRWITRLISECANQPLQVEVQEVRINPPGGAAGGEGGGFFGGRGFDSSGGGATNLFPDLTGLQTFPAQPNIVNVVIQGIIYIFNEPNPDALKTSEEEPPLAMLDE